eukprot:Gregarina_sp_Poly_1__539@NODE_112_length_13900_cov_236_895034_g99_i0_p5_GENE_NODE_112_length_13900_cov_236_895034_g99_i0NODE_112_length_13900_cov_236_895034_g99_i0_p5_ORF_typecomplete_len339_score28_29Scramblase/PF03803_15/9_3e30HEAT_PBS/PF03130_16/0_43HEAT_PBS/PF03130_16/1_4e04_NODE_112_length_13900_cov_236_895034_g99_i077878803
MTYTLPEPYTGQYATGEASGINLTGSQSLSPAAAYHVDYPPPATNFDVQINERTPLLAPKQQRVMGPKDNFIQFSPLDQCRIARLSECSDNSLVGIVQDLVGLQDSRSFQIVDMERKQPLFVTRETANCCERNCFPARCRPEHTEIFQVLSEDRLAQVAKMDRSCCGGSIAIVDSRGKRLGSIHSHMSCSRLLMTLDSNSTRTKYTVSTDRWGAARWLGKLPFGSCRSIQFKILAPNNHPVAIISNEWTGLCRELFTDADDYFVEFGRVEDSNDRLLLLSTAIFIDSLYFSGMCCSWTLRGLVLKKFNPVAKMGKVGKLGKYLPTLINAVAAQQGGRK